MTGVVTLHLYADTLDDAVQKATERWRKVIGQEDAELPWSVHFNGEEDFEVLPPDVGETARLHFTVVIEFDRTVVDGVAAR